MATIRARKVKSVVAKVRTKKNDKERAKPFPSLPKNPEGLELNKYTSKVSVDVEKQSMPPAGMFVDDLHYWQTLEAYLSTRLKECKSVLSKIVGMTAEERAKERADRNALKRAQAAASSPEVQQLAMQALIGDPAKLAEFLKDPIAMAQFNAALAAAQASTTQQTG